MKRFRHWSLRVLRILVLVYVGVAAVMYSVQNRFIFPGADTQGQREAQVTRGANNELLSLTAADGCRIAALFGKSTEGDSRTQPTIIFLYGNGGCIAYCTDIFERLRKTGANVIVPDYEGYGMSSGKPSEAGCYATADACYEYLLTRKDIDPARIVPMGQSLGAGAAIDLASRRPVAGLITVSAFTSLHDMAHAFIPWLPMSLILKYRFDNVDKLNRIECPVLIIHGTVDDLVPFSCAEKLASAAKGKVTRYDVDGAGHNDLFDVGGQALYGKVRSFLQNLAS